MDLFFTVHLNGNVNHSHTTLDNPKERIEKKLNPFLVSFSSFFQFLFRILHNFCDVEGAEWTFEGKLTPFPLHLSKYDHPLKKILTLTMYTQKPPYFMISIFR